MQGFNTSIKQRYKEKWVKSVTGSGPRKEIKKLKPAPTESKRLLRKRKRRQRVSALRK